MPQPMSRTESSGPGEISTMSSMRSTTSSPRRDRVSCYAGEAERGTRRDQRSRLAPGHVPDPEAPPRLGGGVSVEERPPDEWAELVLGGMADYGGRAEPKLEPCAASAKAEV